MSQRFTWVDRDLHIYRLTLPVRFDSVAERQAFLEELYQFVQSGPAPLFALIDMTQWRGGVAGMTDPAFLRQIETKDKVRGVAIVTHSASARFAARTVEVLFRSRGQWGFFDDLDEATTFIRERAREEMGKTG